MSEKDWANKRRACANSDARSSAELVQAALETLDESERWEIVPILHARGGETEFVLAKQLCASGDKEKRCLGADILAQLGWTERSFQPEAVAILIELLEDGEPGVLNSAAVALGHRDDLAAVPYLIALKNHPDRQVRHGVILGLLGFQHVGAISTLVELTNDPDPDVRNWAIFGLATHCESQVPELDEALFARLGSDDPETRGEALIGLCRISHPDAVRYVGDELARDGVGSLALQAAEILADPALHPALCELKARCGDFEDDYLAACLDDAIKACSAPAKQK